MAQFYTNRSDESDPHKLPDAEVFYMAEEDIDSSEDQFTGGEGWYVWACFPGCMPDSEAWGPYKSEAHAVKDWRDKNEDEWPDAF